MKKASKFVIGGVIIVSALAGIRAFAGHGMGCHNGDFRAAMADRMMSRVSSELSLTDAQKVKLDELVLAVTTKRDAMKSEREQGGREILALLDTPTLDQSRVNALIQEKVVRIQQEAPDVVAAVAGFTDSLTAEQRAQLRERIQSRMMHRGFSDKHQAIEGGK